MKAGFGCRVSPGVGLGTLTGVGACADAHTDGTPTSTGSSPATRILDESLKLIGNHLGPQKGPIHTIFDPQALKCATPPQLSQLRGKPFCGSQR